MKIESISGNGFEIFQDYKNDWTIQVKINDTAANFLVSENELQELTKWLSSNLPKGQE